MGGDVESWVGGLVVSVTIVLKKKTHISHRRWRAETFLWSDLTNQRHIRCHGSHPFLVIAPFSLLSSKEASHADRKNPRMRSRGANRYMYLRLRAERDYKAVSIKR